MSTPFEFCGFKDRLPDATGKKWDAVCTLPKGHVCDHFAKPCPGCGVPNDGKLHKSELIDANPELYRACQVCCRFTKRKEYGEE